MTIGTPLANRVIHVASGREWRGGQHQVLLLARGQRRHGVDTVVVTGVGTALARRLEDGGVPVVPVRWAMGLDPRVAIRLVQLLSAGAVVHAHDSHAHALADMASRICGTALVVTRRVITPIRRGRRYRRAAALIAISIAVRRQLLAAGVDPARVHLIPDAIDPDDTAAAMAGAAASAVTPLVVCVAALAPEKGIDTLLDAAALVHAANPEVRWRVVGEGAERRPLLARRHELGLDEVVEFAGAGASAAAAFREATMAVQPSRSEGLGSAVLQALALGVPVIATDAGGLPDALAHGGGVMVPAGSPSELARAVQRLVESEPERALLSEAGRAAADYFSVDRLVERTADVYRSIAHLPGSR